MSCRENGYCTGHCFEIYIYICIIYFQTFYSGILSGIYSDILSGILSGILSDMGNAGQCLAVEAQQCPLRSGACG